MQLRKPGCIISLACKAHHPWLQLAVVKNWANEPWLSKERRCVTGLGTFPVLPYSSTSSDPSLLQASNLASLTHQQKCSPTKQSLQVQSINPFPKKTFHWTRLFATLVHVGIRSTVFSVLTREAWTFGCTQFLMRYCVGIWKLKVRVDWFKHLWQTPVRTRHHLGPCCWSTEILNRPVVAVAVCWNYNWPGNQPDKGKRSRTAHRGCGVGM